MDEPAIICRKIYVETKEFYNTVVAGKCRLGFKILYGPPLLHPPILFLGYQPGGGPEDCTRELAEGAHDGWPAQCEYADRFWPLALKLREIFGQDFLRRCTGLNAIFFRSPDVETYLKDIDVTTRSRIDGFCCPRVDQIIRAIRPQKIVAIGFKTLDLYGVGVPDVVSGSRVLTRIGEIAGCKTISTLHLSGARISSNDRNLISARLKAC